jgi:hypothetical protein
MKYYIIKPTNQNYFVEIWVNNSGAWTKGEERANINKTKDALQKIGGFDLTTLKRNTNIDGKLAYRLDIESLTISAY